MPLKSADPRIYPGIIRTLPTGFQPAAVPAMPPKPDGHVDVEAAMAAERFWSTQRIEGELSGLRPGTGGQIAMAQPYATAIVGLAVGLVLVGLRALHTCLGE